MGRAREARIAVAGPIALVAAMLSVAVTVALSDVAPRPVLAILAVLPVALCFWLCSEFSIAARVLLSVTNLAISAGVAAAVLAAAQAGVGAVGFYAALWGPAAAVLAGTLAAQVRSGEPLLGPWLLWWVPVAAGLVWAEPFALAVTGLAGVDGLAGLAMFVAPILGMAAWAGAVSVAFAYARFTRGHLTSAST
ncbi:MAG: hypothetical protein Q8K99_12685 [Actinomycetota bacterium]|nr:hypothetical protein [Actinomycetota bacterium]